MSHQQRLWEPHPTIHQAVDLTRGIHATNTTKVMSKGQRLRRHTSDPRSSEQRRDLRSHDPTLPIMPAIEREYPHISPQSSGYASVDITRATDYPHWRGSRSDIRTANGPEYKLHPRRHESLTDVHRITNEHASLRKKSSVSSLDRNSYSEGSQSSYTGSLAEQSSRLNVPHVADMGYRAIPISDTTPNSSQSDFSESHGRYSNRATNFYSLPRSRSSLTTIGTASNALESEQGHKSYNHPSGVLLGRVWPVEEEDDRLSAQQSRTINITDEVLLPQHIPPYYFPRSSTSPSFSSEAENEETPWYEQDDPNIHSGLYFPPLPNRATNSDVFPSQSVLYRQYNSNGHIMPHSTALPHYSNRISSNSGQAVNLPNPEDRTLNVAEQKILSQQRLAHYFNQSASGINGEQEVSLQTRYRRESSPADMGRSIQCTPQEAPHPVIQLSSDPVQTDKNGPKHKKATRSRSGAFGKLVKKLGSRKSDKSKEQSRNKNNSSTGNLDDFVRSVRRSHSMEQIQGITLKVNRNAATPSASPVATPKFGKGFFRVRRNSEPDLQDNSVGTLFRTGSKKNLSVDPTEALFEAIEAEDVERCQSLLEDHELVPDVNSPNDDDWTPLDLAVMLNDSIAHLLLAHGAKDSLKYFKDPNIRYHHLANLLRKSEREYKYIGNMIAHNSSNSKEMEKQLVFWSNKFKMFHKMKNKIERSNPPGPPRDVQLIISSDRSLNVKFSEPDSYNGAVVTRYKIQWSKSEQFGPEMGEFIMCDTRNKEYTIPDLDSGEKYYVRVSAFNLQGFGLPKKSVPEYAIPSSWHDYANSQPRFQGSTTQMEIVAAEMSQAISGLQQDLSSVAPDTPIVSNRRSIRRGFSKLFSQGVKFHKVLKIGVYLCSVIYSDEGRVLVTMDDQLPIVEVSDSHASSVGTDFAWLAKVACTWENVQDMCDLSESYTSSPAIQFRNRLLHAMLMMQDGVGLQDLGLLHHRPYQDSHGTVIFVVVHYLEDYKTLQGMNIKWSSIAKLRKKRPQMEIDDNPEKKISPLASDQLLQDIPSIVYHHTQCSHILPRGLYLGYLRARSSVASSMTVVTSSTLPNVLPYYKVRSNPNISRNEWSWLQALSGSETSLDETNHSHQSLQKNLLPAIDHFLEILDIPEDEAEDSQLYTEEVIELNENVTFLLIMPPPEQVCTPPGGIDQFEGPNFSHMPISTFELLQLYTYQRAFIMKFTEVSARLDIELLVSQKRRREAFSKAEIAAAKNQHEQLQNIHEKTEHVWKQMRWIETALQTGRDTAFTTRLTLRHFREKSKQLQRAQTSSTSSTSSAGTLSPVRKTMPNILPSARYIRVFPAYETGLPKGTSVKIYVTPTTTTDKVILVSVEQLEKTRRERGIPGRDIRGRDLSDFYLVAVLGHGHREETMAPNFTPLQLLNYSPKYKFVLRRWSLDQETSEV